MTRLKAMLIRDHSGHRFSQRNVAQKTEEVFGVPVRHLRVFSIPDSLSWQVNPWLMYLRHRSVLRSMMRDRNYDLILVHFVHPSALSALRLGALYNVPVVIAENETLEVYLSEGSSRGVRWMLSRLRTSEAIITQCEAHAASVRGHIEHPRILILPLAFDPQPQQLPLLPSETPSPLRCVFLGRLDDENKGVAAAIEGVMRVRRETGIDVTLTVIGDGVLRGELERLAAKQPYPDAVTFSGWIARDSLSTRLRDHHVFLFPSAAESFGLVYLEAAEAALPMIVNRNAGVVRELLRLSEGIQPILESTTGQIAEALIHVHDAYPRFRGAAIEAREGILEAFSWEKHAEQYRQALTDLLKEKRPL